MSTIKMSPARRKACTKSPSDLFHKQEPLCAELSAHLEYLEKIGPCVRHPLVYAVPYFKQMNAFLNAQLAFKKKAVKEKLEAGEYPIFLYERPYRIERLCEWTDRIKNDKEYWEIVASVYTDSENIYQYQEMMLELMLADRPYRACMMDEEERIQFDQMLDSLSGRRTEIQIMRGHRAENQLGMSWTISRKKAEMFANRFMHEGQPRFISHGTVQVVDVIAYFTRRGEYEIVVDPNDVTITRLEVL